MKTDWWNRVNKLLSFNIEVIDCGVYCSKLNAYTRIMRFRFRFIDSPLDRNHFFRSFRNAQNISRWKMNRSSEHLSKWSPYHCARWSRKYIRGKGDCRGVCCFVIRSFVKVTIGSYKKHIVDRETIIWFLFVSNACWSKRSCREMLAHPFLIDQAMNLTISDSPLNFVHRLYLRLQKNVFGITSLGTTDFQEICILCV